METAIYKVNVMYKNLSAQEAGTVYILAHSLEEAEDRAKSIVAKSWAKQALDVHGLEYLVERKVIWIAVTAQGMIMEG